MFSIKHLGLIFSFSVAMANAETAPMPPKDGHPPMPPKAAIAACSQHAEHDSCSFSMPDGKSMSGVCSVLPQQKTLVCGPKGGMHPPKDGKKPADHKPKPIEEEQD